FNIPISWGGNDPVSPNYYTAPEPAPYVQPSVSFDPSSVYQPPVAYEPTPNPVAPTEPINTTPAPQLPEPSLPPVEPLFPSTEPVVTTLPEVFQPIDVTTPGNIGDWLPDPVAPLQQLGDLIQQWVNTPP